MSGMALALNNTWRVGSISRDENGTCLHLHEVERLAAPRRWWRRGRSGWARPFLPATLLLPVDGAARCFRVGEVVRLEPYPVGCPAP